MKRAYTQARYVSSMETIKPVAMRIARELLADLMLLPLNSRTGPLRLIR
jgi:hypothetical protein